jgi:hypothetical protein
LIVSALLFIWLGQITTAPVEQFLQEKSLPVREPITVIEPDLDILALMGKPSVPLAPKGLLKNKLFAA